MALFQVYFSNPCSEILIEEGHVVKRSWLPKEGKSFLTPDTELVKIDKREGKGLVSGKLLHLSTFLVCIWSQMDIFVDS